MTWMRFPEHNNTFSVRPFKRENDAATLAKQGRSIHFQVANVQMKKWRKRVRAYLELFCQHIDCYIDNGNRLV